MILPCAIILSDGRNTFYQNITQTLKGLVEAMMTYLITIRKRADGLVKDKYVITVKCVADAAGHANRLRDVFSDDYYVTCDLIKHLVIEGKDGCYDNI